MGRCSDASQSSAQLLSLDGFTGYNRCRLAAAALTTERMHTTQSRKKKKRKTMPFGTNLMRSQKLYRAAQAQHTAPRAGRHKLALRLRLVLFTYTSPSGTWYWMKASRFPPCFPLITTLIHSGAGPGHPPNPTPLDSACWLEAESAGLGRSGDPSMDLSECRGDAEEEGERGKASVMLVAMDTRC